MAGNKKLKKEIYSLVTDNSELKALLMLETKATHGTIYRWGRLGRPELNQYHLLVIIMNFINDHDELKIPEIKSVDDLFELETIEQ